MRLAVRGFVRVSAKSVFLVVLRRASSPRSPTRTGLLAGGGWTITSKHAGGCWAPTGAVPACLLRRPRSSRCGSRRAAPARRGGCRYAKLIEALYVSLGPATPRSDNATPRLIAAPPTTPRVRAKPPNTHPTPQSERRIIYVLGLAASRPESLPALLGQSLCASVAPLRERACAPPPTAGIPPKLSLAASHLRADSARSSSAESDSQPRIHTPSSALSWGRGRFERQLG